MSTFIQREWAHETHTPAFSSLSYKFSFVVEKKKIIFIHLF